MIWMDSARRGAVRSLAKTDVAQEFYSHVGANLDSSHAVFRRSGCAMKSGAVEDAAP